MIVIVRRVGKLWISFGIQRSDDTYVPLVDVVVLKSIY